MAVAKTIREQAAEDERPSPQLPCTVVLTMFGSRLDTIACCVALASLSLFLFDRHEHATVAVPLSQCRKIENAPSVCQWTLPESVHHLAAARTPRRDSSFLFVGHRLIPLRFAFDSVAEAEREMIGWHAIHHGQLTFRLPDRGLPHPALRDDQASGAEGINLRLELNGTMSIRRQFAWVVLLTSLLTMAVCRRPGAGFHFGLRPLLILAALAPLVFLISFYVGAIHRLPWLWRSSAMGIAFDRVDAVAPGLLLMYALCGWYRNGASARVEVETPLAGGAPSADRDLRRFIQFGWLAGVTLILLSFTRMVSWGVGVTYPWSPVGISSPFCGAIAFADAEGYLSGVYHLINGGTLDQWNQRRPVNAAWFAARLVAAGWNLDAAKWIQAALAALSAGWAARELALTYGWRAGTAALALFWGCGRLFLTTTLSEPLGFTLGAMALGGLLRQLRTGSIASGLAAIALMALAQAARPGALLVLPALAVGISVWGRSWRDRAILFALSLGVAVAAMAINPLLSRLYGTGENLTGSNFAYTFAGLASGQSWAEAAAAYQDQLDELPDEKAVATFLYREGFRLLRSQPQVFLGELARGVMQFATELPRFLTGVTSRSNVDTLFPLLWLQVLLMFALAAQGLRRQWTCQSRQDRALWLAIGVGCMASVPIVFLDGGLRILIATWPAMLAWLAAGLAEPQSLRAVQGSLAVDRGTRCLIAGLVSVIGVALLAPWVSHRLAGDIASGTPQPLGAAAAGAIASAQTAAEPWVQSAVDRNQITVLRVDRRMSGPEICVDRAASAGEMTEADWQRELQVAGIGSEVCLLHGMPEPPFRFRQVFDLDSRTTKVLFLPGNRQELEAGFILVGLCGDARMFGRYIANLTPDTTDAQADRE